MAINNLARTHNLVSREEVFGNWKSVLDQMTDSYRESAFYVRPVVEWDWDDELHVEYDDHFNIGPQTNYVVDVGASNNSLSIACDVAEKMVSTLVELYQMANNTSDSYTCNPEIEIVTQYYSFEACILTIDGWHIRKR